MWRRQEGKLAVEQERKDEEVAMGGPIPQQSRDTEEDALTISPIIDENRPVTEKGKESADTTTVEKQVKGGEIF
jgi:hypothetical protein